MNPPDELVKHDECHTFSYFVASETHPVREPLTFSLALNHDNNCFYLLCCCPPVSGCQWDFHKSLPFEKTQFALHLCFTIYTCYLRNSCV